MEIFDQIETIPIYQSSLILLNMAAGAIVMQEYILYTFGELITLILCSLIAISGVWLII